MGILDNKLKDVLRSHADPVKLKNAAARTLREEKNAGYPALDKHAFESHIPRPEHGRRRRHLNAAQKRTLHTLQDAVAYEPRNRRERRRRAALTAAAVRAGLWTT